MVVASSFELGGVDCVHGQRCELGVYTVVGVVSLMSPQQRYDDPRSPRERKRETGTVPSPTTSVSRSCRACHRTTYPMDNTDVRDVVTDNNSTIPCHT